MKYRTTLLSALLLAITLTACSQMEMKKEASLYDRLGGKPAITAVVDDFIGNVAGDARINGRFGGADIPHLKMMLVEQICAASGGPCTYTGKDMVSAHKGMKIRDDEFGALVGDLVKSLDKFKVPDKEKNDLLGALGGMKPQIVGQ
jgi:hemoglobin